MAHEGVAKGTAKVTRTPPPSLGKNGGVVGEGRSVRPTPLTNRTPAPSLPTHSLVTSVGTRERPSTPSHSPLSGRTPPPTMGTGGLTSRGQVTPQSVTPQNTVHRMDGNTPTPLPVGSRERPQSVSTQVTQRTPPPTVTTSLVTGRVNNRPVPITSPIRPKKSSGGEVEGAGELSRRERVQGSPRRGSPLTLSDLGG